MDEYGCEIVAELVMDSESDMAVSVYSLNPTIITPSCTHTFLSE